MRKNSMPLVHSRLSAALVGALFLPFAGGAMAQEEQADSPPSAKTLDKIVVTGSLIPTSETETATPVTVISAEDIQARGFQSVTDALTKSTFATGATQGAQTSASFTQGAETISLFGLSPSYVKYLIDGRPLVSYPALYNGTDTFNNISGIPIDLVDRIEILPGGQSSLYGSDAIAGVINIILKKRLDGGSINVRGGAYSEGGGSSARVTLANGFSSADGRFNLLGGVQYEERDPIWGYQRDMTKQFFTKGTTSTGAASPPIASRDFLIYSPFTSYKFLDPANCANTTGLFNGTEGLQNRPGFGDGLYCGSQYSPGYRTLLNGKKSGQVYAHATFDVNDNVQLYGDVLYNNEKVQYNTGSNYSFWATTVKYGYFYDPNLDDLVNLQRAFTPEDMGPEGFRHTMNEDKSESSAVTFGAKGTFASKWDYDLSASHSQYDLDEVSFVRFANAIDGYFDRTVLGPQQGLDPYYNAYPVFTPNYAAFYQPITQADFDSFTGHATSKSKTSDTFVRAQVTNSSLFALPGGDAGLAFVVEGGRESWDYNPDPGFLNGAIWGQTAVAGSGDRDRAAVTSELRLPVVKMLTATVSGRYDRFKTDENTIGKSTYSVGLEFRPLDTLLFRGKYGTAFKAPTLSDLFQGQSGFYSFVTDYYGCSQLGYGPADIANCPQRFASVQYFGTTAGNPELNPINADVWSLGTVFSPTDRISLSVDYFHYNIQDEVTQQSADQLSQQESRCRNGLDDINSPICVAALNQITRNAAGTITEIFTPKVNVSREIENVITAAGNYRLDLGTYGNLNFRGSFTQILKHEYAQYAGDAPIDYLTRPFYSTDPRRKADLSVGWSKDAYDATLYANWFDKTPNYRASLLDNYTAFGADRLPSYTTWNLSLGYSALPNLQFALLVNNLFDKMPPTDFTYPGTNGAPYNSSNFDVYGRSVYLQAKYSFGSKK